MSFINPILALVGAAAVAIPIIIHLLRRRKPPIRWGAMRFVVEAQRKTRRRTTLDRLLLLLARCALVLALGLALGRPLLGLGALNGADRPVTMVLVLDDSITSGTLDENGNPELTAQIDRARSLLDELSAQRGDRAALITLAAPASAMIGEPSTDIASVRLALDRVQSQSSDRDLTGGARLVRAALEADDSRAPTDRPLVAWLSGSRGLSADDAGTAEAPETPESLAGVGILSAPSARTVAPNFAIERLAPRRSVLVSGSPIGDAVGVTVSRDAASAAAGAGSTELELAIRAADGSRRRLGASRVSFEPGERRVSLEIPIALDDALGASPVLVASLSGDRLEQDNAAWQPVEIRRSLRVVIASRVASESARDVASFTPADWFEAALQPSGVSGGMDVRRVDATTLDPPTLAWADALVLTRPDAVSARSWADLRSFVTGGGALLLCPSHETELQLWTDAFVESFGLDWTLEREPSSSDGLPVVVGQGDALQAIAAELAELVGPVRVQRSLGVLAPSAGVPLRLENDQPLLIVERLAPSAGAVAFLTSAPTLDWTNLPAIPLMVPLTHELLRQSVTLGTRSAQVSPATRAPDGIVSIETDDADVVASASESGALDVPVRRAGVYNARTGDGLRSSVFAVNPDADASDTTPAATDSAATMISRLFGAEAETVATIGDAGETAAPNAPGLLDESLVANPDSGARLAVWLLAIALTAACVEVLLARRASQPIRVSRPGASVRAAA